MQKASTLEQAYRLFDPRPLDFEETNPQGDRVASNRDFYAPLPGGVDEEGVKRLGPIERLRQRLLSGQDGTKLFLSGHIGSGKSTELNRLRTDAEIRKTFDVVPITLEEHEWATLDSAQLIFRIIAALYGAHRDRLEKKGGAWKKKLAALNERVFGPMGFEAKEGSVGLELNLVIIKLKQDLKFSEKARKQFREYGETQRSAIQDFIAALVDDIENALTEEGMPDKLLVIVDDLDKLRTEEQHKEVFDTNLSALVSPPLRVVYTVPSAVRFGDVRAEIRQNGVDLFPVRVLKKAPDSWSPELAYTGERIEFFESAVARRVAPGLVDKEAIRLAAMYSGGVLRDFFRLLREGVLLAQYNERPTLDGLIMKHAVAEERRRESIGLYSPDYAALVHVHRTNGLPVAGDRRYLMLGRVIECFNGTVWFEAHPILWMVLAEHAGTIDVKPDQP